jgi:hypothetical protein
MDAVLCLRETTHFQSMELERPEAICGVESGTRSRLWSTRGDCACRQEVAFFGLRLAGTEIACLNHSVQYFLGSRFVGIEDIISPQGLHHRRSLRKEC